MRRLGLSGVGLLSTIIAAPVAIGLQAGGDCVLAAGGRRDIGRLKALRNARKHDFIRGLAESKLHTIADHISVALNDNKITEEEFRLILSEVDKFNEMNNEIPGRQKQSGGLSEYEKTDSFSVRETKP